jgi:hypothetical protein
MKCAAYLVLHNVPYKAGTAEFDAYIAGSAEASNTLTREQIENAV